MSVVVYPLNNIDFSAEDVSLYAATRSSGIYSDGDFAPSITGTANTISVDIGLGWLRLSKFVGVVVALKNKISVDMGIPDSVYPRIDAVVLQFDANKNGASVIAKKGNASNNPQPPERAQTEALYELHLAHIIRNPGTVAITAADVLDVRLDSAYCGIMADAVTKVDTSAISAQIQALIKKLKEDLAAVTGETYYASKDYVQEYVQTQKVSAMLYAGSWSASAPYTQNIIVPDLNDQKSVVSYVDVPEDAQDEMTLREETSKVSSCRRSGNTLTFRCLDDKPNSDIPIIVEVRV